MKLPFTTRPWALPALAALYRCPEWDRVHGTRHKTPEHMPRLPLARLVRWFPQRQFVFVGDSVCGTGEITRFCQQHHEHLTLVSKVYGDAALYDPPPLCTRHTMGHPRVQGPKLASRQEVVAPMDKGNSLTAA